LVGPFQNFLVEILTQNVLGIEVGLKLFFICTLTMVVGPLWKYNTYTLQLLFRTLWKYSSTCTLQLLLWPLWKKGIYTV